MTKRHAIRIERISETDYRVSGSRLRRNGAFVRSLVCQLTGNILSCHDSKRSALPFLELRLADKTAALLLLLNVGESVTIWG